MKHKLFWQNPGYQGFPTMSEPVECEYLIVGGGITGLTLAYELGVVAGKDVVLVEGNQIGSGATGHSAGLLSAESERYAWQELIEEIGADQAAVYADQLHRSLHFVKAIVDSADIDCDFNESPYYFLSPKSQENYLFRSDNQPRHRMGIESKWLSKKEIQKEVFQTEAFESGERLHSAYSINPLKFAQGFAHMISSNGPRIFESSAFDYLGMPQVNGYPVKAQKVLLATDAWGRGRGVRHFLTTVAITEPLPNRLRKALHLLHPQAFEEFLPGNAYHYGKLTQDHRLLLGYGDDQRIPVQTPTVVNLRQYESIKAFLARLFPLHHLRLEFYWTSVFALQDDEFSLPETEQDVIYCGAAGTQVHSILRARNLAAALLAGANG